MGKPPQRCAWTGPDPDYIAYHDTEWGVPTHDDRELFEFLILEGAQAGLSWITILKRRSGYRRLYKDFDVEKVAAFTQKDQDRLLQDPGIIRNKLKVKSSVKNAQIFMAIQEEYGSFDAYIWQYVDGKPQKNNFKTHEDVPAATVISDAISEDLKKRGMSFVGTTIIYAYMQSMGLVNDHTQNCFRYNQV